MAIGTTVGSVFVKIRADGSKLGSDMDGVGDKAGRRFGAGFSRGFKALKVGAVLAAGLAAVFVKKAVEAASGFETEMNQVFTLMPGASKKAMDAMSAQVLGFASDMGVLPETVIPALYQALSAGVPANNVFDFMKTAQKAALGGATDLETAVDGISSAVNAYGADVLSAAKASDDMFTAVRLGKCIRGDQRVVMSDGTYRRIDEMSDGGTVVAYDGRGLVPAEARWVSQGKKPTVTLETRLGRKIVTTWNHPYLVSRCRHGDACQRHTCKREEWVKVKDMAVGDRVAVPTHIPVEGTVSVDEHEASMLGLWLAEGTNALGSVGITTADYGDEIELWAAKWGLSVTGRTPAGKATTYRLTAGPRGTRVNPLTEWLRGMGLGAPVAKHVPAVVFGWDRESTATMLRWFFNGDGWLADLRPSGASGFQVGVCSKDEQLIRDVSHLLLRFGIVGRVRHRPKVHAWVWETNRWSQIDRFVRLIGIDRPAARLVSGHEPQKQRRHVGQIEFDPVVAIVENEPADVYDLMVDGYHNFVAEDMIAHNTTFPELARSLFNVTPVAAALGVSFDDVTAGLAAITAQGTPTSVAATQMRQLFVELSKAGGQAATTFQGLAGKSFQDFIAGGGDVAGALAVMAKGAGASGLQIQDMFSSVEAGQAALQLSGNKAFVSTVKEMGSAAGATGAAYDQMDQGIARSSDRIAAKWATMKIRAGDALAPIIEKMMEIALVWAPKISAAIGDMVTKVAGWLEANRTKFEATWNAIRMVVVGVVDAIRATINNVRDNMSAWAPVMAAAIAVIVTGLVLWTVSAVAAGAASISAAVAAGVAWAAAAAPLTLTIVTIAAVAAAFTLAYQHIEKFRAAVDAVGRFVRDRWRPVLDGIRAAIVYTFIGLGPRLWALIRIAWDYLVAKVKTLNPINLGGKIIGSLPGVGLFRRAAGLIPGFASGAVLTKPTLFVGGEGGSPPEIVTPQALMAKTFAAVLARQGGGGDIRFASGAIVVNMSGGSDREARRAGETIADIVAARLSERRAAVSVRARQGVSA